MRFLRKTRPRRRRAPQPGPGGQVARLSETIVAFACLFPCGIETAIAFADAGRASIETAIAFADAGRASIETVIAFADAGRASIETAIAFAGAGRASIETVIAFAGEKWVFLVHFSGAEVMPVSEVPCWGRAVVLLVSTSPRCRASCVKKVRPAPSDVGVSAKSSPRALTMAQIWRFLACWASFFVEMPLEVPCWASFSAPIGPAPRSCRRRDARGSLRWGFCSIRNWPPACRRRVTPLMTPFPPLRGAEVAA